MNKDPKIVLIDIGAHKCEELCVLLGPGWQAVGLYLQCLQSYLKRLLCHVLRKKGNNICNRNRGLVSIREHMQIIAHLLSKPLHKNRKIAIIVIEPNWEIVVSRLNKLGKKYNIIYLPIAILGHDSDRRCGLEKFFVYKDDLSNSLYLKKHLDKPLRYNLTFSVKFKVLVNELFELGIINNHDKVILRMNCEGAELGILRDCLNSKVNVEYVMGSIADIEKVHGNKAKIEGDILLKKLNTSFCYFKGSDPSTWLDAISIWENIKL